MQKYIFLILLFISSFTNAISGQTEAVDDNYMFRRVSPEGGLGDNGLRDVVQDSWGFVWLITVHDLFRFDGYTFKRYTNKLPKFKHNSGWDLNQLALDADGIVFVASHGGLLKYNPFSDSFDQVYDKPVDLIKRDARDRLWICSDTIGIFDAVDNTFTPVYYANDVIKSVSVIYEDTSGFYLATNEGEIYRLEENELNFKRILTGVGNNIKDMTGLDSTLFVLTEHEGMFVVDLNKKKIEQHHTFFYSEGDTRHIVRHLHKDKFGHIWISTQKGAYVLDPVKNTYTRHQYDESNSYGLPSSSIWKIADGNQDNLWIGSYSGGLSFLSFSEKSVFKSFNSKTDALSFPVVSSIVEQGDYVWVGTEGGGLNRYDMQTGEFRHYTYHKSGNGLSFNNVNSLQLIGDDLWISLPRGGLDRLNTKADAIKNYSSSNPKYTMSNDHIAKIVVEGDSVIWFTYLEGNISLSHFSLPQDRFKHFFLNDEPYNLEGTVADVCMGNGDTLWVATAQLYMMNTQSLKVTACQGQNRTEWNPINIQTISHHKKTGDVWIGTSGQGLIRYAVDSNAYVQEAVLSKFGVHAIYAIEFDDLGNVWCSTDNGLFRYSPADEQLLQFNKADGTQGKVYCRYAAYKSRSGKLYFGGNEGFTIVDPTLVSRNEYKPDVIISELLINNEPITPDSPDSPLKIPIYQTNSIRLQHDQNNFGFEYTSSNYLNPAKNRFRYRLHGYDDDWMETDALHRIASYAKVPAGKYVFEIITANNDGMWGQQRNIDVTVAPAPWLSNWAIALYGLIGLGIILAAFRYANERRKLKMQLYLEEKEHEQKEEYHQEQLRFFTNVSHDFRTPLSLIMAAFDNVKPQIEGNKYKETIENNVKRLLHLVNELLDFRALQNGKMRLKPEKNNWNEVIRMNAADFFEYASQKGIQFSCRLDEHIPSALYFDPKVMEKILLNLLNNAFKYTSDGGFVTVTTLNEINSFCSSHENSYTDKRESLDKAHLESGVHGVSLVISDSGIGISDASISKVFERYYRVNDTTGEQHIGSGIGLALVKSLVGLHGGNITIYSERNKGTDIVVTFYLKDSTTEDTREIIASATSVTNEPDVSLDSSPDKVENLMEVSLAPQQPEVVTPVAGHPHFISKKLVLLVEDNDELRELIAEMLSEYYEVLEAENGAVALKILEDENPELILTDIMMPVMNGTALCRSVKENLETSHIPVVMLTAKSGIENQIEGMETGADAYIEKPVNKRLLLVSLANLFKQQERIKEYYSKNYFADAVELKLGKRDSEFMEALQNEIEKQISDPDLDVNHLASSLAISRSKLYTKTKALTGKSVVEFIRVYRLRKIARLLLEEDQPINIIIEKAGIDNPSYFSRIFKKEFGMTPTEFIDKNRKDKEV